MNQAKETAAHHIRIKDDMDSETVRKLTEKRAVAAQNEYDRLYYNSNACRHTE